MKKNTIYMSIFTINIDYFLETKTCYDEPHNNGILTITLNE